MSSLCTLGSVLLNSLEGLDESLTINHSLISEIERLSPSNLPKYSTSAFELFTYSFPNPDEREPIEDIIARIENYSKNGPDADGGEFFAHVFLDNQKRILAYSQGSVMPCGEAGLCYFWQYGAVADDEFINTFYKTKDITARKQGISKLIHEVNSATLRAAGKRQNMKSLGEIWETEEKGFGDSVEAIRFTFDRLTIHNRAGGRVLMGVSKNNEFINLHLQPRLTKSSEPIALHLMYRPLLDNSFSKVEEIDKKTAECIVIQGFLENFRREQFPDEDVNEAIVEIKKRFEESTKIVLLPANEIPDSITIAKTDKLFEKQLLKLYEVDSIEKAQQVLDIALTKS